jgi:hypothetical protein
MSSVFAEMIRGKAGDFFSNVNFESGIVEGDIPGLGVCPQLEIFR